MAEPHLRIVPTSDRDLERLLEETRSKFLREGGGSGTYDGMDGWQQSVETRLTEIRNDVRELRSDARTDFRLVFGAIIALALGLSGMMAKGFGWI